MSALRGVACGVFVAALFGGGVLAGRAAALREDDREEGSRRVCIEAVLTHLYAGTDTENGQTPVRVASLALTPTPAGWLVQVGYTAAPGSGTLTYRCTVVNRQARIEVTR